MENKEKQELMIQVLEHIETVLPINAQRYANAIATRMGDIIEQECQRREKEAVRRFAEKVKEFSGMVNDQAGGYVGCKVSDDFTDLAEYIDRLAGEGND